MELLNALMNACNYTRSEAIAEIKEMRRRVKNGEHPEEILYEYGLEPDYFFDLV